MKPQRIPHRTESSPSALPAQLLRTLPRALGSQLEDPGPTLRKAESRAQIRNQPLCSLSTRQNKCSVQSQVPWLRSCPRSVLSPALLRTAAPGQRGPEPLAQHPWELLLRRQAGLSGSAEGEQQALRHLFVWSARSLTYDTW